MLTQFFDSFKDNEDGDFNMMKWIGKVGACQVKHDEDGRAKLQYFPESWQTAGCVTAVTRPKMESQDDADRTISSSINGTDRYSVCPDSFLAI